MPDFSHPWFLLLLGLLPLARLVRGRSPGPALRLPDLRGARQVLAPSPWLGFHQLTRSLRWLALVLLCIALAGPRLTLREVERLTEGINIVLAVDLSESMAALDMAGASSVGQAVNRLEAVKKVAMEFIGKRYGDRIGLVVFGSEAYTQMPLTRDYDALIETLERLEIGAAGPNTAIGDALGISVKRLADVPSPSNIVILLTDGRSNAGELPPMAAAEIAARKQVKVHTIGVGGRGPAPFAVNDPLFGRRVVYQNVDMDEETLERIARATEGRFYLAEKPEQLAEIYAAIDRLETSPAKVVSHAEHELLYPWFLGPAFLLLFLWIVLNNTRFLRLP
jgi:Ca-activated chloride channel homolog